MTCFPILKMTHGVALKALMSMANLADVRYCQMSAKDQKIVTVQVVPLASLHSKLRPDREN
jgi:hypothetical protein